MFDKKFESWTRGSKHKLLSSAVADIETCTPSKHSKTEVRSIEVEFPEGYTLLDKINTAAKPLTWKTSDSELGQDLDNVDMQIFGIVNEIKYSILKQYCQIMSPVNQEGYLIKWLKAVQEYRRVQMELDKVNTDIDRLANMYLARKLFDQEEHLVKRTEHF